MLLSMSLSCAFCISLLPFCANLLLLSFSVPLTRVNFSLLALLPFIAVLLLETVASLIQKHSAGVSLFLGGFLTAIAAALSCILVAISYLLVPLTLAVFITTYHYEFIDTVTAVQSVFSQSPMETFRRVVTSCLFLWTTPPRPEFGPPPPSQPRWWRITKSIYPMYVVPIPIFLCFWVLDQLTVLVTEPWKHTQFLAGIVRSLLGLACLLCAEFGRGVMWLGGKYRSGEIWSVGRLALFVGYLFVDVKLTIARSVWRAIVWVVTGR